MTKFQIQTILLLTLSLFLGCFFVVSGTHPIHDKPLRLIGKVWRIALGLSLILFAGLMVFGLLHPPPEY